MKLFIQSFAVLLLLALCALAQNVAVLTHKAVNSAQYQRGFPGDWPYLNPLDVGDSTNVPVGYIGKWIVIPKTNLLATITNLYQQVEDWSASNRIDQIKSEADFTIEQSLKTRLHKGEFAELKLDALQSEFVGLLLHAYLQNTELLLLVTKAVGASALTNNLTAQERQRVAALRPQISFPRQDDFTAEDRARAVAIRDNVLIPHYQLYQAAKSMLERIRTNAIPEDPLTSTNWPAATIGE